MKNPPEGWPCTSTDIEPRYHGKAMPMKDTVVEYDPPQRRLGPRDVQGLRRRHDRVGGGPGRRTR